jgi:serine protease SohB
LFSGEYWTGRRGLELGLADSIGNLRGVLRERFGDKVRTPLIAERGFFGRRVPGVGASVGAGLSALWGEANLAEDVIATLETRALWARYGL